MTTSAHDAWRVVASVAALQHGVVSTRQLLVAGVTQPMITRMTDAARLHRRHRGVYAVGHDGLSRTGGWWAAVLACGDGAALSHVSAAQHWEITRRRSSLIHVSTPRYRRPIAGVTTHLLRPMQEPDGCATTSCDGLTVTTITRTIVDLAELMDAEELAFVMHEAAYRHVIDIDEVQRVIEDNRHFRGRRILREALSMHLAGDTGARSRLERRVRTYLESLGYATPRSGFQLRTAVGDVELDLAWPRYRVNAEVDGAGHARASARRKDRERDRATRRAGWQSFRIDGAHFDADPAGATHDLRTCLDDRHRRLFI